MSWIIILIILIAAFGAAMFLMQRMTETQQKLASLHDELRRNDEKLQREMQRLREAGDQSTQSLEVESEEKNVE